MQTNISRGNSIKISMGLKGVFSLSQGIKIIFKFPGLKGVKD